MATVGDVTIVVTSYMQSQFVKAAVSSAMSQTVACRVVLVDDGSDDGSVEVAERLGVEAVSLAHRGALATFRSAVDLVETPFYVLLNADDLLDTRYVELTRPLADVPDVGFVYTAMENFGAETGTFNAPGFNIQTLKWGNYVHAASLTRKAAYESVGGFDSRFTGHHEDWALWLSMARNGWRGVALDLPLLRYRHQETQGRNPEATRDIEKARWRLFWRDPALYGLTGLGRLIASSAKVALTGR